MDDAIAGFNLRIPHTRIRTIRSRADAIKRSCLQSARLNLLQLGIDLLVRLALAQLALRLAPVCHLHAELERRLRQRLLPRLRRLPLLLRRVLRPRLVANLLPSLSGHRRRDVLLILTVSQIHQPTTLELHLLHHELIASLISGVKDGTHVGQTMWSRAATHR